MKRLIRRNHSIYAMSRIGYIDPSTEARIYTDDSGQIPHMHIYGDKLDCCVKLDSPKYFPHGHHKSKLNSKQVKELVDFLKSKNPVTKKTNWKTTIMLWNLNNSSVILPDDTKMPDYLNELNK